MKKYDKYKNSGIEWIGEIPEHWSKTKLKYKFYLKARVGWKGLTSDEFKQKAYAYLVTGTDFKNRNIDWNTCYQVEKERYEDDPFIQLEEGDLLITKDGTIGKVSFAIGLDKPACLNSGIFVLRPTGDIDNRFFYWVLSSNVFGDFNRLTATGSTIQHLYQNVFVEFEFAYPEITKQQAIANYLDQKCAAIDNLIEQKQKLISLYEENRQSMINQAVTRGLNPNVKMKDSGVEWIGEIPEHWEVKRLKNLVSKIGSGVTPSGGASVYQTSGIPLLRSQNIYSDGLRMDDVAYITEGIDEKMQNSRVIKGDVLLNITGGSIGRCYYYESLEGANVNQHVCIIRSMPQFIEFKYLHFVMVSQVGQLQIDLQQTGANREGLNFEQLKSFSIPYTSIDEQTEIVNYLERRLKLLDNLLFTLKSQIDLYQEYKQSLIFNAVTGKIKVVD